MFTQLSENSTDRNIDGVSENEFSRLYASYLNINPNDIEVKVKKRYFCVKLHNIIRFQSFSTKFKYNECSAQLTKVR